MCKLILREVSNIVRLFFSIATGVMFAAALAPTTLMLSGNTNASAEYSSLGVSVLLAGSGSSRNGDNHVYWSDLNTANACQNGTEIYEYWSVPNRVCSNCNENLNGGCFGIPTDAMFKIVICALCIALAVVLAVLQLIDFLCCGFVYMCWPLEVVFTVLLVCSSVLTFPFWTTTGMQPQLIAGGYVPLFAGMQGEGAALMLSDPVVMTTSDGYGLMIAGFCFALLDFFALFLPNAKKEDSSPPPKAAGKGCCHFLFCCCLCNRAAKKADAPPPAAAAAAAPPPAAAAAPSPAPPVHDPTQSTALTKV